MVIVNWPLTIRGGSRHFHISGGPFFYRKKSDFKTIYIKKNQKIPRGNSKQKLKKNMVERKMTRAKLEIFC